MKKYYAIFLVAALLLFGASTAYAAPTSWDLTSAILQPLQNAWTAQIKGSYFTATSTTATSTFPQVQATQAKIGTGTGLLKSVSGYVTQAVLGTDYSGPTSGSSLLYGNGSGGFSNATVGTGLSFVGGTLSATGGSGSGTVSTSSSETATRVPFWTTNSATPALLSGGSSAFTFDNTNSRLTITNASTTNLSIGSLSGLLKAAGGTVSTATNGTDYSLITALTCSAGQFFSAVTATGTFTCSTPSGGSNGLGTTTPWTQGQVAVVASNSAVYSAATSTPSVTYPVQYSGTLGNIIGGSSGAFSLAFGTTTSNTWAGTQAFTNSPVFSTIGAGTVNSTAGGTIYNTATTSVSSGTGISFGGTAGALIGGTNLTITNSSPLSGLSTSFPLSFSNPTLSWIGLATSSNISAGQALYATGANTIAGVATTTVSCSGSVSCTTFNVFGTSPITITGSGGGTGLSTSSPLAGGNLLVYNAGGAGSAYGIATSSATLGLGLTGSLTTVGTGQSLSIATSSLFTGTTGQNAYFSGTNTITGTSTLFISNASYVGIGTTSPWAQLSINPDGITGPAFAIGSSTATKFLVTNGGRVGIGNTNPGVALEVTGDITSNSGSGTNTLTIRDGQISKTAGSSFSFSTGATTVATTQANGWTVGSGTNGLYAPGSTDLQLFANGTNLLKLTSGGVVGVATTTPSPLFGFDVATTTYFATTTTIGSQLNLGAYISNDAYINLPSNGALVLNVPGQTPQFRLLPNGTDIYFQNTNSSGNIQFTGLSGNPLSGNVVFNLTGKLGIGTTTPGSLLSLNNIANFTTATSTFYSTGGINLTGGGCFAVNGTCISGGSGTNYFTNSGASTYLSTGTNLGVGTTSPWANFSVGMASTTPALVVGVAGSSTPAFFVDSANNSGRIGAGTSSAPYFFTIDGRRASTASAVLSLTAPSGIAAPWIEGRDSTGSVVWSVNQFGNVVAGTYQGTGANLTTSAPATSILNISTSFGGGQTGNAITIAVNGGATLDVFDKWGRLGVGTSSLPWMLDVATSSIGTQFNGGQLALTDTNAALNKKHWVFASEGGNFYLSTSTDLFATTTLPAFSVLSTGFVGIATANPTNWLTLPAGLVSLPSLSFGDATTGLFRSGLNAIGFAIAGVEKMTLTSNGLGISSTTPLFGLSVGAQATPAAILAAEYVVSTSTNMTLDFKNGNQQLIRTGTAAATIGFTNALPGAQMVAKVCNPPSLAAGAITWTGVEWSNSTVPTQTTTAGQCDIWSFNVSAATSTTKIFGAQTPAFP